MTIQESNSLTLTEAKDLKWGTYGLAEDGDIWKLGPGPLRWVKLEECSTDHLLNILITQRLEDRMLANYIEAIRMILKDWSET